MPYKGTASGEDLDRCNITEEGQVDASKVVTTDSNKDVFGFRNLGVDKDTGAFLLGTKDSAGNYEDGSWRISISSDDITFQRKESGSWVTKGSFMH